MQRRVLETVVSMESKVSQQLQHLNEFAKSLTTGQNSNESVCFSSHIVQGDFIKSISSFDKKKEMNGVRKSLIPLQHQTN